MSESVQEALLLVALFVGGAVVGLAWRGPRVPWLALLLPVFVAPGGMWLTLTYC
jgi:hypothetical protein